MTQELQVCWHGASWRDDVQIRITPDKVRRWERRQPPDCVRVHGPRIRALLQDGPRTVPELTREWAIGRELLRYYLEQAVSAGLVTKVGVGDSARNGTKLYALAGSR